MATSLERKMLGSTALELLNKRPRCFESNEELLLQKLGLKRVIGPHDRMVNLLSWSPNGRYLLSASDDSVVKLWSINGDSLHTLKTQANGKIESLKFLPCSGNSVFAYTNYEKNLFIQDFERGELLVANPRTEPVRSIATTDNHPQYIYCLYQNSGMAVYDIRFGTVSSSPFELDYLRTCFDVCRDRPELVAFGRKDGSIMVYDVRNSYHRPLKTFGSADSQLKHRKNFMSYVRNIHFNEKGTEIIMTDGFGAGYLFDLNDDAHKLRRKLNSFMEQTSEMTTPQSTNINSSYYERTVEMMQELIERNMFTKAIEISTESLYYNKIVDPLKISVLRHMRTMCYSKRAWAGDKYMCLKEMIKAYEMNPDSCHILYDLIKYLAIFGQYTLALDMVEMYKRKFTRNDAPSISLLESQIMFDDKKPEADYSKMSHDCDFIDYKERYVGFNNTYTSLTDVNFFGSHQQYIVASTQIGSFMIYEKNSALLKIAMHDEEDKLRVVLPNPLQPIIATSHVSGNIKFWEPKLSNEQDIHRIDDNYNLGRFFIPKIVGINDHSDFEEDSVNIEGQCRVN